MRYQTLFSLLLAFIFTGCGPSAPKISINEAVERGDIKTLKEHLEFGTDVNARKDGRTCLHTAAWLGHTELAKLLIAGGAELDSVDDKGVFSPLHAAMAEDHFEMVELLISEGADVNVSTPAKMTCLHVAVSVGVLGEIGHNYAKNPEIKRAKNLNIVRGTPNVRIIELLIAAGADVNARSKEDLTPLHLAAVNGIEEVCELLISEGADIKAVADNGHTPLSLATAQGNREIVILLRRHLTSRR